MVPSTLGVSCCSIGLQTSWAMMRWGSRRVEHWVDNTLALLVFPSSSTRWLEMWSHLKLSPWVRIPELLWDSNLTPVSKKPWWGAVSLLTRVPQDFKPMRALAIFWGPKRTTTMRSFNSVLVYCVHILCQGQVIGDTEVEKMGDLPMRNTPSHYKIGMWLPQSKRIKSHNKSLYKGQWSSGQNAVLPGKVIGHRSQVKGHRWLVMEPHLDKKLLENEQNWRLNDTNPL